MMMDTFDRNNKYIPTSNKLNGRVFDEYCRGIGYVSSLGIESGRLSGQGRSKVDVRKSIDEEGVCTI